MEVVNFRTRFGRWIRHFLLADETHDRSEAVSHSDAASSHSLSHGFALLRSKQQEDYSRGRAFLELYLTLNREREIYL